MDKNWFINLLILLFTGLIVGDATSEPLDSCMFVDLGAVTKQDSEYVNKGLHRCKAATFIRYMEVNYDVLKKDTLYLCLPNGSQIGFKVAHRDTTNRIENIKMVSLKTDGSIGQLDIASDGVQGVFRDRIQDDLWTVAKLNEFRIIITNRKGSVHIIDEEEVQIRKRESAK